MEQWVSDQNLNITGDVMNWTKAVVLMSLFGLSLSSSMLASADAVEQALTRVTIVVDGMMKSKSGAT